MALLSCPRMATSIAPKFGPSRIETSASLVPTIARLTLIPELAYAAMNVLITPAQVHSHRCLERYGLRLIRWSGC